MRVSFGTQERKLRMTFCEFAWVNLGLRMNSDEIHPLRIGRPFFSRILLRIRRLAAHTRSPVPIRWQRMEGGRVRGSFQTLVRSMLDVVGCRLLAVGVWMLRVGRLDHPRHAPSSFTVQIACPNSRRKSPRIRRSHAFGSGCRLSSRLATSSALRWRQL
jgi:hypothetical protein